MTAIDLPTAIEALKIAEQKTRMVRQGLEAQIIAAMVGGRRQPIEELGIAPRAPSANLWRALLNSY